MRGERERQKEPATGPTTLVLDQNCRQNTPQRRRRRDARYAIVIGDRTADHGQGLSEAIAVLLRALFYLLSRSREYRVCSTDHEQGSWPQLVYLRAWRRRLLLGLFHSRGAEQSDPRKGRGAALGQIEKCLAEDGGRPIIFHPRSATCSYPEVKGITGGVNSPYYLWRMEDAWLDRWR
jgi:hypothetical protein